MNVTYQFQTMVQCEQPAPVHPTFMKAWDDMFKHVFARMKDGNLTRQELETTIWVESTTADGRKTPMYFYDARDLAISVFDWTPPKV